jgi:hypothetical protein
MYLFRVEESFKGLPPEVKQVFIYSGVLSSRSVRFDVDHEYLIYTGKIDARRTLSYDYQMLSIINRRPGSPAPLPEAWQVWRSVPVFGSAMCSGSRILENNDPDLPYLRRAARGELDSAGSIVGLALQNAGSMFYPQFFASVPGAIVAATGGDGRIWQASTLDDGTFALNNIPPGRYSVALTREGFLSPPIRNAVDVPSGGCAGVRTSFETKSTLTGTVLHADGSQAANLDIEIGERTADGTVRRLLSASSDKTNVCGLFTIKNVPMGNIVLGINIGSAPTKNRPYPTTYAPGTSDQAKARIFTLKPGEKVIHADLRLPERLPFGDFIVEVQWSDGSPVTTGVSVRALWNGRSAGFEEARSSPHIRLPLALGRTYDVTATVTSIRDGGLYSSAKATAKAVHFTRDGQILTVRVEQTPPR